MKPVPADRCGLFLFHFMDKLRVDEYGFVYLDHVRICRIALDGRLEFYDRNKLRSDRRGSQYVYATPETFYRFIVESLIRATVKADL